MKSTILAVAIVIAGLSSFGCGGNSCEDTLTAEEEEIAITAIQAIITFQPLWIIRQDLVQGVGEECADYLVWEATR